MYMFVYAYVYISMLFYFATLDVMPLAISLLTCRVQTCILKQIK